jgi:hypothetical protein
MGEGSKAMRNEELMQIKSLCLWASKKTPSLLAEQAVVIRRLES